jgi:hypothetical protein
MPNVVKSIFASFITLKGPGVRRYMMKLADTFPLTDLSHRKDGIVSLGLAGAGRDGHEEHVRFASACVIARTAGLAIVTHAGLEG